LGPILAIGLEGRTAWRTWYTGHDAALALAGVQIGLTIGIGYLVALAVVGTATVVGAPIILVGAVLVAITAAVTAIQVYIARSRIEDFLSLSFWGDARTLRYWDDQSRPPNEELLDTSRSITLPDEGVGVRRYFEAELDAFYYLLFSPTVRITEHMSRHPEITRQGERRILSEFTSFVVSFPAFDQSSCTAAVRVFEANRNWVFEDEYEEITDLFERRMVASFPGRGAMYRFTHYNHNNRHQLELLIEYVKDDRKITGDEGLRIILNGNDVEELGVDERLTFEM